MNKPDLNAPRFRPTRIIVGDEAFFKEFSKKFPQYSKLKVKQIREIITMHSELMWKEVIDNRHGIELPENLGTIFVGTCQPPKKKNINFKSSGEYKQTLKHRNFESDNYIAKIFYTNYDQRYKFKYRQLWKFKGTRDFTRSVAEHYPENWKQYLQVENFEKINKKFNKHVSKDFFKTLQQESVLEYDEFDFD